MGALTAGKPNRFNHRRVTQALCQKHDCDLATLSDLPLIAVLTEDPTRIDLNQYPIVQRLPHATLKPSMSLGRQTKTPPRGPTRESHTHGGRSAD
jgi:hypothetical protein